LRRTNLVTTDTIDQPGKPNAAVVALTLKPVPGRFASSAVATGTNPEPAKSTKSAANPQPKSACGLKAAVP
jgi:hypothetical protein